jgi:hypothetical protein
MFAMKNLSNFWNFWLIGLSTVLAVASLTGCQSSTGGDVSGIETFQAVPLSDEFSKNNMSRGGGLDTSLSAISSGSLGNYSE